MRRSAGTNQSAERPSARRVRAPRPKQGRVRASGAQGATAARRAALRELLAAGGASSQEALQRALEARGIHAAQATISRDLVSIGATRVSAAGGARYGVPAGDAALPIEPVRGLVEAVDSNGLLIVVRTKASAAPAIARALDDARLPDVLGTLAGDDTIFVAPRRPRAAAALVRRMRRLFGI